MLNKDVTEKNFSRPSLSVVISALNEEDRVELVLKSVLEVFKKNALNAELIFLNNHSTDKTGEIAAQIAKSEPLLRVIQRYNRPSNDLGSSLKEGLQNVRGDYFMIMDCDLSHNPNDIPLLYKARDRADIVIGSRFVRGGSAELHWKRRFLSRLFNIGASILTGIPVRDLTTGFKLYKMDKIKDLKIVTDGFGFHVELPIKAYFNGATFLEVPIHYGGSPKASTLNYRRQFRSYTKPVIWGFIQRIKKKFN